MASRASNPTKPVRGRVHDWIITGTTPYIVLDEPRTPVVVTVIIKRLPEGVYLAISDDVPGLVVEADSVEEAIRESRDDALDLLELDGYQPDRQKQRFVFIFPDAGLSINV